jgi:hypothetical protein
MFIFLGDSQPLGYEIGIEIKQGPEHMPQEARDKIYNPNAIHHECRPDLAYPELLSKSLSQDYVNLAYGGTCHQRHLNTFQQYLKKHDVPRGSTVFLNSNCKSRGFLVDSETGQALDFMNTVFMMHQIDYTIPLSDWHMYLKDPKNLNICDMLMRISPYQNLQAVNHIGLLCDSLGLNFLYFPISPCLLYNSHDIPGFSPSEMITLKPSQIFTLPDNVSPWMNRPGHWLQGHLSAQGQAALASDLNQVYLERCAS